MKFGTKATLFVFFGVALVTVSSAREQSFVEILKTQVGLNGFQAAAKLYRNPDENLAPIGKVIFQSTGLSLNGNISCKTCHLDQFGSGDGIPVAAAIGGTGEGPDRLMSGAQLLPRNALPFWEEAEKTSIHSSGTDVLIFPTVKN